MFVKYFAFSVAVLISIAFLSPDSARAQTAAAASGPFFTVLDIGKIRRDAASVKSIREQIINYQNQLQSEIQKEQDAVRKAQQELAKKQTLLAPEAFADERRKFEQRIVGVQQMVQDRRRKLEEAQTNAMLQVERALNEIVARMAETKGYDVIVRLSQVVYVKKSLDITSDVLKELDKTLPTINVALPSK